MPKKPIEVRVSRTEGTPEGNLLEFLKNYPTKSTDEMVLTACRAFWMPLALRRLGIYEEETIKAVAIEAKLELLKQAEFITQLFGLEPKTALAQEAIVQLQEKSQLKNQSSSVELDELKEHSDDFSDMPQVREFIKLPTELEA
ncbi:hypothetical protein [Floridanema evergladense]|uniref:Phage protein n=1 Tax=Floridaenema evergladense BLCC-F167 TaxID=3153639 RepID=A0ABV4WQ16_9CYAN